MIKAIGKIREKINNKNIVNLMLIFLLLQPLFDILSFLDIRNLIPIGISTYVKPIIVFGVGAIIYLIDKEERKKWTILYVLYAILVVGHLFILNRISTDFSVILHELRFMINMGYMLVLYIIFDYMYYRSEDREETINRLKKTLVATFIIYCVTIIISIITGTSGRTYEYSDASKLGYKGWLDSGQIFGHALSICLPFIMYYLLSYKTENKIAQILFKLCIIMPVVILCLIGTKVTLFMCIIIVLSYVILSTFFAIKNKEKSSIINIVLSVLVLAGIFLLYTKTPTYYNMSLQGAVDTAYKNMDTSSINWEEQYSELKVEEIPKGSEKYDARTEYNQYNIFATQKLIEKYTDGSVLPSDIRAKQLIYNLNKYKVADVEYKIFGLGYLNQPGDLAIEKDILMSLFSFGILGFITMFIVPISLWIRATYLMLRNIRKLDLETLLLYEGFSSFFFISFYAGYTFIYTNFSIFLVAIMYLLIHKLSKLKDKKISNKSTDI